MSYNFGLLTSTPKSIIKIPMYDLILSILVYEVIIKN